MELNENNIEEQILLLADGELDAAEAAAVMAYIGAHTEYRAMLELYRSVKLEPEESIVFPGKELLLQEETAAVTFRARTTHVWHWAAAVILFLVAGIAAALLLQRPGYKEAASLAKLSPIIQQTLPPAIQKGNPVASVSRKEQIAPKQARKTLRQKTNSIIPRQSPAAVSETLQQRQPDAIASLATVERQALPVSDDRVIVIRERKETVAVAGQQQPSWSPLKAETIEGVNELLTQVRGLKEEVREKGQLLRKATIVLRLGDKEIALNK
jgi:hypothetical protein